MGSFNGYTLTQKGRELLAKGVAGERITFTKMKIGDGVFNGDIKTLTSLVKEKADFSINQIKNMNNGEVILKTIMSNALIVTGFHIKELGIYAYADDNIEVLYAYNKAIEFDFMPAFNSSNIVEFEYQNYIIVDQAQDVTALIDPSIAYLTQVDAEQNYVSKTQIATEKNKGILSLEDIRKTECANTLGANMEECLGVH